MVHPLKAEVERTQNNNKREGVIGHNARLKKLTEHYGAADPAMYKTAKGGLANGPQEVPEFGAEGDAPVARGDRSRRSMAANPIATYKRGGRIRDREKAEERASGGEVPARAFGGGVISRAKGGRTRGKGATHVNVIIQQPSGNKPMTPPMPVVPPIGAGAPPGAPPMPPPGGPMAGPPGMGAGPGAGPMPPGLPPPGMMPPRKRGGRIEENSKAHPDAKEDAAEIKAMVKPSALKRARGGMVKVGLTGGSESGPGRLEKTAARARRQAGDKDAEE